TNIKLSESNHIHFPHPSTFNRGECIMNPVRYFVVLSLQRSGTGWFNSLLNSHTNISMYGELFAYRYLKQDIEKTIDTLDKVYNMDLEENITPKNECTSAIGFIWMLHQNVIRYRNVTVPYIKSNGILPIFLFRKNPLRCIISLAAAVNDETKNVTEKFHTMSKYEAHVLASYKPTINKVTLVSNIKYMKKQISKCFKLFNDTPHIRIYYEDLLKNPDKWLDQVQDFIKVPRQKLRSDQIKIHNGPISSLVSNWEEIVETLNGTKYQKFLYED
ncbi:p-loop containing nucleoside triphosphate hydrolase family protein-like protein, partial [Genlisea aurea]